MLTVSNDAMPQLPLLQDSTLKLGAAASGLAATLIGMPRDCAAEFRLVARGVQEYKAARCCSVAT